MATVNVYQQYFAGEGVFNGVERHGVSVMLVATSEEGRIKYEVGVAFFPHASEDDFAVSYDAYFSEVVYEAAGRRSKKREKELLDRICSVADKIAAEHQGAIDWEHPMAAARKD